MLVVRFLAILMRGLSFKDSCWGSSLWNVVGPGPSGHDAKSLISSKTSARAPKVGGSGSIGDAS